MVDKLNLCLFEKQVNAAVPSAALAANDFLDVIEPCIPTISPDAAQDDRGSGKFDQYLRTIGRTTVEIPVKLALYSRGTGLEPDFVRVMQCAGWERQLNNPNIVMKPVSEGQDAGTLWIYRGNPGASQSLLEKFDNVMFDGSIDFESGKKALLTCSGRGKYLAKAVVSTQPAIDAFRERIAAPAFLSATVTINGVAYNMIKAQITFGQAIVNNEDPTDEFGGGDTEMATRNIEWSATVYMKPVAGKIPHTNLYATNTGTFDIQWGTAYGAPDLQCYAPQAQITDVKPGNNSGVSTWELKGIFVENDVELRCFFGTTSSLSSSSESASSDSNSSSSTSASNSSDSASSTSA